MLELMFYFKLHVQSLPIPDHQPVNDGSQVGIQPDHLQALHFAHRK
jgi:hypothetical protein